MKEINVLPRDRGAAPLDFVIAVMAFLAALATAVVLVIVLAILLPILSLNQLVG